MSLGRSGEFFGVEERSDSSPWISVTRSCVPRTLARRRRIWVAVSVTGGGGGLVRSLTATAGLSGALILSGWRPLTGADERPAQDERESIVFCAMHASAAE